LAGKWLLSDNKLCETQSGMEAKFGTIQESNAQLAQQAEFWSNRFKHCAA
jgi:hypothetical protein